MESTALNVYTRKMTAPSIYCTTPVCSSGKRINLQMKAQPIPPDSKRAIEGLYACVRLVPYWHYEIGQRRIS
jgi:hypothetical protein